MPGDDTLNGRLRLAIAQVEPALGDIAENLGRARKARAEAARAGADLVVFPAGFLAGCPRQDVATGPTFARACMDAVGMLAAETSDGGPGVVIGCPFMTEDGIHDAVAVLDAGRILAWRSRVDMPLHRSFEAPAAYRAGPMPGPVAFRGVRLGIPIGDDVWGDLDVCETLAESGAELLLVSDAAPFRHGGLDLRHQAALRQVIETDLPLVHVNGLGGQGDGVMDGASFAFQSDRTLALQALQFAAGMIVSDWAKIGEVWRCETRQIADLPGPEEAVWRACVLAIRTHAESRDAKAVAVGLYGDRDSAIVAAMAVDALGPACVHGVVVPDAAGPDDDADAAAAWGGSLGAACHVAPPADIVAACDGALGGPGDAGVLLRSRLRGMLLTVMADRFGAALLGATNLTALRLGIPARDGVLADGLNPIADLSGGDLADLARWREGHRPADCLGPEAISVLPGLLEAPPAPVGAVAGSVFAAESEPIVARLAAHGGDVDAVAAEGFDRNRVQLIGEALYMTSLRRRPVTPGLRLDGRR
ncbi:nitrilase-related carbon-nitrogen hydrolase [Aurantimonas sp. A2-1-M11]|uniref:nitrilase-related carbon-nitrogen hydrolase n=1 Tax=Aurantimonas sp. A2-1-M11 TaxID=3113712 RepID=UPI002F933D06